MQYTGKDVLLREVYETDALSNTGEDTLIVYHTSLSATQSVHPDAVISVTIENQNDMEHER